MRRLPWALLATSGNAFFSTVTFGSSVFVLYLGQLGISPDIIGLLMSFFPFCGILGLLCAPAIARFGFKRTFLTFYSGRKLIMAALLFTPLFTVHWGVAAGTVFTIAVILLFAIFRALAETAYYPWYQEFVPNQIRGRFAGISTIATNVAGLLAVALAGWVLHGEESLERYQILIGTGAAVGFAGILLYTFIRGGEPHAMPRETTARFRVITEALHDRRLSLLLLGAGLVALGGMLPVFLPLYLKEHWGLSSGVIVTLDGAVMLGGCLTSIIWGWAADHRGLAAALVSGPVLMLAVAAGWLMLPATLGWAYLLAALWGAAFTGHTITSANMLFNRLVSPARKGELLPLWYAWVGVAGGIGPLLAGQLLARHDRVSAIGPTSPYTWFLLACMAVFALGAASYMLLSSRMKR